MIPYFNEHLEYIANLVCRSVSKGMTDIMYEIRIIAHRANSYLNRTCVRYTGRLWVRCSAVAPNMRNSLPCTVRTSKQRSCNKRVGCLLCSMAMIYDLWYGSLDKRKVRGLVPLLWSGAQVLPHPTHSYILVKSNLLAGSAHTFFQDSKMTKMSSIPIPRQMNIIVSDIVADIRFGYVRPYKYD